MLGICNMKKWQLPKSQIFQFTFIIRGLNWVKSLEKINKKEEKKEWPSREGSKSEEKLLISFMERPPHKKVCV